VRMIEKSKIICRSIGVVVFIIILWRIDIYKIAAVMVNIRMDVLVVAAVLSITVTVLKSMRWKSLLEIYGVECALGNTLKLYLFGTFWGAITPGKVGEFSRIYYVKRMFAPSFSYAMLSGNVLVDRFFDIVMVGAVAICSFPFYFDEYLWHAIGVCGVVAAMIGALLGFHHVLRGAGVLGNIIEKVGTILSYVRLRTHFVELVCGLRLLNTKEIVIPILYNIAAYCAFYVVVYLIAYSLKIDMGFFYLIASLSTAMIFSIVPVTVAGLGIREAILLFFFSRIGVTSEVTMSFSLVYLLICIILPSLLGSIVYFLMPPVVDEKQKVHGRPIDILQR